MSHTHIYSVPTYYPNFHCKAGDCRHPCCTGWDIAISMKEYFRMLGMNCSPELRHRLDCAFHPATNPDENHYAVITPRWDGDCPLHLPNGYCGLQCECGEDMLPSICRYYPRSPKTKFAYQCQCSNSCEAVLELLFNQTEPLTFLKQRLTFGIANVLPHHQDKIAHLFPQIQRACLHILQDRSKPLSLRLQHLGEFIIVMDIPYRQNNATGLHAVIPFHTVVGANDNGLKPPSLSNRELSTVLKYIVDLLAQLCKNNDQWKAHVEEAYKLLSISSQSDITEDSLTQWRTNAATMAAWFPDNDRILEQVFANHLCYDEFPYSAERQNMWDSYSAFCTAYALVRFFSVCHLASFTSKNEAESHNLTTAYIDIVATVFRLVAHTNFVHNISVLTRRLSFEHPSQVTLLCRL